MKESAHTIEELRQFQAMPLTVKIRMTQNRIRAWVDTYGTDGVYVSFSGGKDSTVLLHLVRELYPDVPAVFVDTGLEYPEIREFVKIFDNVTWLKPKMNFRQVIEKYGYPIVSKDVAQSIYDVKGQAKKYNCAVSDTKLFHRAFDKNSEYCKKYPSYCKERYLFFFDAPFEISHKCCDVMKKKPAKEYEKQTGRHPILATMAEESRLRKTQWLQKGCNAFDCDRPRSAPMSFWTEQDILRYIKDNNIPICSVYGDVVPDCGEEMEGQMDISDIGLAKDNRKLKTTICNRTGCMFCMFGCTARDWDNFERYKETHPKIYDYIMRSKEEGGLNYKEVIDWINEHGNMNIRY